MLYFAALSPLSFLLHSSHRGMILDALNLGLPCFPSPFEG